MVYTWVLWRPFSGNRFPSTRACQNTANSNGRLRVSWVQAYIGSPLLLSFCHLPRVVLAVIAKTHPLLNTLRNPRITDAAMPAVIVPLPASDSELESTDLEDEEMDEKRPDQRFRTFKDTIHGWGESLVIIDTSNINNTVA